MSRWPKKGLLFNRYDQMIKAAFYEKWWKSKKLIRVNADGSVRAVEKAVYSYCQGVYLGACVELAARTGDAVWLRRSARAVSSTSAPGAAGTAASP